MVCSDSRMKALGITANNNHIGINNIPQQLAKAMDVISVKGSIMDICLGAIHKMRWL